MLVDFDPTKQEALITPDLAMKFLVWAVYYNDLTLNEKQSFSTYADAQGTPLFAPQDAARLDRVAQALFRCFGAQSVENSSAQMRLAKLRGERCPFTESSLNDLFGHKQQ